MRAREPRGLQSYRKKVEKRWIGWNNHQSLVSSETGRTPKSSFPNPRLALMFHSQFLLLTLALLVGKFYHKKYFLGNYILSKVFYPIIKIFCLKLNISETVGLN